MLVLVFVNMSTLKVIPAGVETIVDGSSGEVLQEKVITREVLVKDNEEWFNTYAKLVRGLLNLDGNEVKVLLWCALEAKVNTNEIALPRAIKLNMQAQIGLSIGSIENALGRLVQKNLLHRTGRAVYHLDPESTWRGDLKTRAKNVQVFINYTIEKP